MKNLNLLSFFVLFLTNTLHSQIEIDTTREHFLFDTTGFYEMHQEQLKRVHEMYDAYQKNVSDTIKSPRKSKGIENIFGAEKNYRLADTLMLDSTFYNYDPDYLYAIDEIDNDDTIGFDTTSFHRYYRSKTISSFELLFGSKAYNSSFYNSFNTLDHIRLFSPIYELGFGYSGRMVAGPSYSYDEGLPFDGHWSYHMIIPFQINVFDSINANLSGSTFSFSFGKDLFYLIDKFDLVVNGGIDMGRIMLSNSKHKFMKNPFFSPSISVQPKVKIKHFVLSLRVDCWNDISASRWKEALMTRYSKRESFDIENYRQSGMRFLFGIGYSF